ncbi:MAG: hypothetical protein HC923_05220 [Myxococcales bacterium]|nr:hypothetical protein [Myxococcales bacterium]
MLNAWTKHQIKRYITARLADESARRKVGEVPPDVTDWFGTLVADLHAEHSGRLGETLTRLLEWLSSGSLPLVEVPEGVVTFDAASIKRQELQEGLSFSATGAFTSLRLKRTVIVEPGLSVAGLLLQSRSVGVLPPGERELADLGPPTRFGLPAEPHPTLFLRFSLAHDRGVLVPSLHLRASGKLLESCIAASWSQLVPGPPATWRAMPHVEVGDLLTSQPHEGPILDRVLYSGEPGQVSSVWKIPGCTFAREPAIDRGLVDAMIEGGAKRDPKRPYECWLKIPLRNVTRQQATLGLLACNVGIVEAAKDLDFQIVPGKDGLCLRIPGLVSVLSVARAEGSESSDEREFVRLSEASQLIAKARGSRRDRAYIVSGDLLLLSFDEVAVAAGALDEPVRIFCTVVPETSGDEPVPYAQVVAFLDPPSADVQVDGLTAVYRETPLTRLARVDGQTSAHRQLRPLEGAHWMMSTLVGHGRAVTRADIRALVLSAFPGVKNVVVRPKLARSPEGALESTIDVHCELQDPNAFQHDRDLLALRLKAYLQERSSPHVAFDVRFH